MKPFFRKSISACSLCVLVLAGLTAAIASAGVIVDSQGFEQPAFLPGNLAGQPSGGAQWQQASVTNSTAVVQNSVAAPGGGTQSVRVDRGDQGMGFWAVPVSGLPNPANASITVDWDMRVDKTTSTAFGPYFSVQAYDGSDPANPDLLASFGVDASTGEVLYQETGTGFLVSSNQLVPFQSWNHYEMLLDYSTHEFTLFLNGATIASQLFVDQLNVPGGLNHFTDADIAVQSAGGDAQSLSLRGTAYYDNFAVKQVPEPAGAALVFGGLVALGFVRRRMLRPGRRSER